MHLPHSARHPAGHHLAALPVDARIGKLLLLAASLGCLAPALTIAACLRWAVGLLGICCPVCWAWSILPQHLLALVVVCVRLGGHRPDPLAPFFNAATSHPFLAVRSRMQPTALALAWQPPAAAPSLLGSKAITY